MQMRQNPLPHPLKRRTLSIALPPHEFLTCPAAPTSSLTWTAWLTVGVHLRISQSASCHDQAPSAQPHCSTQTAGVVPDPSQCNSRTTRINNGFPRVRTFTKTSIVQARGSLGNVGVSQFNGGLRQMVWS